MGRRKEVREGGKERGLVGERKEGREGKGGWEEGRR